MNILSVGFFHFLIATLILIVSIYDHNNFSFGNIVLISCIYILILFFQFKSSKEFDWIKIFSLKIIISILISIFFIQNPLIEGNSLRTSIQDSSFYDSNFYDYIAYTISKQGLNQNNFHLLFSTWNSFGIIMFIYFIYYLFGINYLSIVFVNSFISVISIFYLSKFFSDTLDVKNRNTLSLAILLPLFSYYDATPSKETLTFLFISTGLYFNYNPNSTKKKIGLLVSILGLIFIRPNLAVIMVLFFTITSNTFFSFKTIPKKIVFLAPIIYLFNEIFGINFFIKNYFDVETLINLKKAANELVINSEFKRKIVEYFDSKTLFSLIFFSPFRLIIWLFLPFPFLYLNIYELIKLGLNIKNDWLYFFQNTYSFLRSINSILIIYFVLNIIYNISKNGLKKINGKYLYLLKFILFFGLIVSSFSFVNSSRYRILIEPYLFISYILLNKKPNTEY